MIIKRTIFADGDEGEGRSLLAVVQALGGGHLGGLLLGDDLPHGVAGQGGAYLEVKGLQ